MKLIVAGSRSIKDPKVVYDAIGHMLGLVSWVATEVVSGTCHGPDVFGEQWAEKARVPVIHFPAEWNKHGKRAGYLRNTEMAKYADAAIVVWDGQSRGSKHMAKVMTELGKPTFLYNTETRRVKMWNVERDE